MKNTLRTMLIPARHWSGHYRRRRLRALRDRGAVIGLCYHRVVDRLDPQLCGVEQGLASAVFAQQMRHMRRIATPISVERIHEPVPAGELRFFVSFDDGSSDTLSDAAPILRQLGIPAVVYVVADHVGTDRLFWWERFGAILRNSRRDQLTIDNQLATALGNGTTCQDWPLATAAQRQRCFKILSRPLTRLQTECRAEVLERMAGALGVDLSTCVRPYPLLDWDDLQACQAAGISLGAHTASHPCLSTCTDQELDQEIDTAIGLLRERSGLPVTSFAYPYGNIDQYDQRSVGRLLRCGVTTAVTTEAGIHRNDDDPMQIPRITISRPLREVVNARVDAALHCSINRHPSTTEPCAAC